MPSCSCDASIEWESKTKDRLRSLVKKSTRIPEEEHEGSGSKGKWIGKRSVEDVMIDEELMFNMVLVGPHV